METGQRFWSRSKIQDHPVEYVYKGLLPSGRILIEAASGDHSDDCEVDPEWFDNRQINMEMKHGVRCSLRNN